MSVGSSQTQAAATNNKKKALIDDELFVGAYLY